jgi:hypothetical protein
MIFGILWIEKVNKISDVITQVKSFFLYSIHFKPDIIVLNISENHQITLFNLL